MSQGCALKIWNAAQSGSHLLKVNFDIRTEVKNDFGAEW